MRERSFSGELILNDKFAKPDSFIFSWILTGVLILSLVLFSGESSANNNDEGFIGITGLVINDTVSKAGNDLFEAFSARWEPIEGLDFTVTISEKPDRIFGGQFWIKVDEDVVYRGRINPRWDIIEETAKTGVQRVSLFLLQRLTTSQELEVY
jgi:Curli assembly protein CsgE